MKKKIIIISSIVLAVMLIILGCYLIYDNNKIVSTIIMDINPSIKITLNKKGRVLNVIPLNEDAKEIVSKDLKGKELDVVVESITEKVIEKGYVEDEEVVILLNATGNIKSNNIEKIVEEKFKEKEVECNIIVQKTNNGSTENAKKYDITESKAAFIEEIIKENKDLKFEDLKDKSVKELNKLKEEIKEIQKEEENKVVEPIKEEEQKPIVEKPNNNGNNPNQAPVITGIDNPPSDIYDTSGVWCTYNKNRPQNSTYQYDKIMDRTRAHNIVLSHLGLEQFDVIGDYGSQKVEKRSSYCIALYYTITTRESRRTVVFDSVTGKIIDESSEVVPAPKYTEDEALEIFLKRFNLKKEDCKNCSSSYGTDMEGSSNFVYRYSIGLYMNDGSQHIGSVNALTGEIYNIAY